MYFSRGDSRQLFSSAFLIGCYFIFKLDKNLQQVEELFSQFSKTVFQDFGGVLHVPIDFGLTFEDCWSGLLRAKNIGWIKRPNELQQDFWGDFDLEFYEHYTNPLNADMHEIVPRRLLAFPGPKNLGARMHIDCSQTRRFSPEYFADIFEEIGVSTVIRLNDAQYCKSAFESKGINHFDLYFEDCDVPSDEIVKEFFRIVDASPGIIAIHCASGLGRTCTLIALYMMRSHQFTARESMGWLRVMRPGCAKGLKLRKSYLHAMEGSYLICGAKNELNAELKRANSDPLPITQSVGAKDAGKMRKSKSFAATGLSSLQEMQL